MITIIRTDHVTKSFPIYGGFFRKVVAEVKAVQGVSLEVGANEVMGVVGESGCGKTTLGRIVAGLLEPDSGEVYFDGRNLFSLKGGDRERTRLKLQMVYQDPISSLSPRMTVHGIIAEAYNAAHKGSKQDIREVTTQYLAQMQLSEDYLDKYPHELSGGEGQRVAVARGLAVEPKLIVADEIVSALDVSVQAKLLALMRNLQQRYNLTVLFISHNIAAVRQICDRTAVMYLGRIVELGTTDHVLSHRRHPYTEALISAVPSVDPHASKRSFTLTGEPPSPINVPSGCAFHPRCINASDKCRHVIPSLEDTGKGHYVACFSAE